MSSLSATLRRHLVILRLLAAICCMPQGSGNALPMQCCKAQTHHTRGRNAYPTNKKVHPHLKTIFFWKGARELVFLLEGLSSGCHRVRCISALVGTVRNTWLPARAFSSEIHEANAVPGPGELPRSSSLWGAVLNLIAGSGRGETQSPSESQSNPGIKMVYPEPCKELRRRPQLFLAGTAPC